MGPVRSDRISRGLTLVEVFVVLVIIGILILLLLPAKRGAREATRRNQCSNHIRVLSQAVLNRESSTQRFPLASTGRGIDRLGPSPMSDGDGYSAIVSLLPYFEEVKLAEDIAAASHDFQEPIGSTNFLVDDGNGTKVSLWDRPVDVLICPSFPDENVARGKYPGVSNPQVSHYHVMVAACVEGTDQCITDSDPRFGGVIVTRAASPEGLSFKEITDGSSRTVLFAESRAEQWSAWFSGASNMTVALPPDRIRRENLTVDEDGYLEVPTEVPPGVNYGRTVDSPSNSSNPMFWESKKDQRDWGPSSTHEGNVVMHAFADGHVKALNSGIDATTYLRIVTRGGGEPVELE